MSGTIAARVITIVLVPGASTTCGSSSGIGEVADVSVKGPVERALLVSYERG